MIQSIQSKITPRIIGIVFAIIILFSAIGTVGAGERGVKTRFGAVTGQVLNEGLYVKIPIIENIIKVDVRIQKDEVDATSASKDLQTVNTIVAINYHLEPSETANIYQNVGTSFKSRLIDPALQESVKAVTAGFTAEELITKRQDVKNQIQQKMTDILGKRGIIVDEFSIVDFKFSSAFDRAIEAKVTAEQNALAAKNKLEQVKFEAEQKVAEAEGKAKALEIEARALSQNPQILELRKIEKWDGKLPLYTGSGTPIINLN